MFLMLILHGKVTFIFKKSKISFVVEPSIVIKGAHYDSILDIIYLSHAQLLVTSSMDRTIKIWDPIARPYSLKHPKDHNIVKVKPGVYTPIEEQLTNSNQSFGEIKRIYTGDQICYKLSSFVMKIPVSNFSKDSGSSGKQVFFEMLITLNLGKAELTGKTSKTPGFIKGYSIDRLQIEVPASRIDDAIPKKYYNELEELCIERRKKSLIHMQIQLSGTLEQLRIKVKLQNNSIKKIMSLLRKISLSKFDSNFDQKMLTNLSTELLNQFIELPFRTIFEGFLAVTGLRHQLSTSELYYYLKRFKQIHPLSITKEEFSYEVQEIYRKSNKLLLTDGKRMTTLIKSMSELIKYGLMNFKSDLFIVNNQKIETINRDKFKSYLHQKHVHIIMISIFLY